MAVLYHINMFYISNCSSIYELQDSKITITRIFTNTYTGMCLKHIYVLLEVKGLMEVSTPQLNEIIIHDYSVYLPN